MIVLRTFSKLFSLAACRLGVMIGDPEIIGYVKNAKLSFDVNAVALLFGERILDHPEIIRELIHKEAEGKQYLLEMLRKNGYECRDCKGNFVFIKPHHSAKEIAHSLEKERKVLVHPYGNPLLKDYIRVSTGAKHSMELFLEAFFQLDGSGQ